MTRNKKALMKEMKAWEAFEKKWHMIRHPPKYKDNDDEDDINAHMKRTSGGGLAGLKLLDEWKTARHHRCTPMLTGIGLRTEEAEEALKEFLMFEERGVETALPSLLWILRHVEVVAFTMIADMLDPDKPGPWKLELRRNVRGAPSEKYGGYNHWTAMEYFELFEELQTQGIRSPAKETKRRLIKRGWSNNDIRRALQWARKRSLKLKR